MNLRAQGRNRGRLFRVVTPEQAKNWPAYEGSISGGGEASPRANGSGAHNAEITSAHRRIRCTRSRTFRPRFHSLAAEPLRCLISRPVLRLSRRRTGRLMRQHFRRWRSFAASEWKRGRNVLQTWCNECGSALRYSALWAPRCRASRMRRDLSTTALTKIRSANLRRSRRCLVIKADMYQRSLRNDDRRSWRGHRLGEGRGGDQLLRRWQCGFL